MENKSLSRLIGNYIGIFIAVMLLAVTWVVPCFALFALLDSFSIKLDFIQFYCTSSMVIIAIIFVHHIIESFIPE